MIHENEMSSPKRELVERLQAAIDRGDEYEIKLISMDLEGWF